MKIKRLKKDIKLPTRAYDDDAGLDIYAPHGGKIEPSCRVQIKLGFAIEIEKDEVCVMSERSGQAIKHGITSIGNIIDAGYRGEVSIILHNGTMFDYHFSGGDKIGQMVIKKLGNREIIEVDELSETDRGKSAHYSSGK